MKEAVIQAPQARRYLEGKWSSNWNLLWCFSSNWAWSFLFSAVFRLQDGFGSKPPNDQQRRRLCAMSNHPGSVSNLYRGVKAEKSPSYPMVNYHCYWKWPFTHKKLWFVIAMLVYRRVYAAVRECQVVICSSSTLGCEARNVYFTGEKTTISWDIYITLYNPYKYN